MMSGLSSLEKSSLTKVQRHQMAEWVQTSLLMISVPGAKTRGGVLAREGLEGSSPVTSWGGLGVVERAPDKEVEVQVPALPQTSWVALAFTHCWTSQFRFLWSQGLVDQCFSIGRDASEPSAQFFKHTEPRTFFWHPGLGSPGKGWVRFTFPLDCKLHRKLVLPRYPQHTGKGRHGMECSGSSSAQRSRKTSFQVASSFDSVSTESCFWDTLFR